jgi:hypothetical protein
MVAHLRGAFDLELAAGALTLVEGDVLDEDLAALAAPPYDVVANLPYHVTSPVLHRLLGGEAGPRPERCILMVQREVAERIAAPPGAMSYLSVFVQYHAAATIVRRVPRDAFEPAPEVENKRAWHEALLAHVANRVQYTFRIDGPENVRDIFQRKVERLPQVFDRGFVLPGIEAGSTYIM